MHQDVLDELELNISHAIQSIDFSEKLMERIRLSKRDYPLYRKLKECIDSGDWLDFDHTEFYKVQGNLVCQDGLILKGQRVFIPKNHRSEIE